MGNEGGESARAPDGPRAGGQMGGNVDMMEVGGRNLWDTDTDQEV